MAVDLADNAVQLHVVFFVGEEGLVGVLSEGDCFVGGRDEGVVAVGSLQLVLTHFLILK